MGQEAVQTGWRHAFGRASPPGGSSHRSRAPCVRFRCTEMPTARWRAAPTAALVAGHRCRNHRTGERPIARTPGRWAVLPVRRIRGAALREGRAGAATASTDCVRGEETPSKAGVDRQVRLILSKTSPAHESIRSLRDVSPLEKESLGTDGRRDRLRRDDYADSPQALTLLHQASRARSARPARVPVLRSPAAM
jgi:hypothetical protein